MLDKDNDGVLSRDELAQGYQKYFGEEAAEMVDKIFAKADVDGSGEIDYSEWIVATIDKRKLLTEEKLRAAFSLFDRDGGGSISAMEVKDVLCSGQEISDEVWHRVVQEVDADGNGEIDFTEFQDMMQNMLEGEDEEDIDGDYQYLDDNVAARMTKAEIMRKQGARIKEMTKSNKRREEDEAR